MGKVALDDDLFVEYFRFKNGKSSNHFLIGNLLSNLKMPFVQSGCQAFRCHQGLPQKDKDELQIISAPLLSAYLSGGYPSNTIEELAKKSQYHLVLTADDTKFKYPYLNINKKNIELNYSKTCLKDESRHDMIDHLKSLCSDAIKVTICDNYLFTTPWTVDSTTEQLFDYILPKKNLCIEFVSNSRSVKNHIPHVRVKHGDWHVSRYSGTCYSSQNHDRYLIIEKPTQSIEVMLSSGFLYLWKDKKEITCIFREI